MPKLNMFFRLTKVDEAQRLVYGIATAEVPDKAREIMDYAGTVPYFKAWSAQMEKASGGKSLGNVREMHSNIAAGVLKEINFNDDEKVIEVCAKVVDDSSWLKVTEGVLTGFSQGGEYVKRWKDPDDNTLTRFIADPSELSLVDNPCLGIATFEYIKADGASEMRKFITTDPKEIGKVVKQVWQATDGTVKPTKEEIVKYQAQLEATALLKKAQDAVDAINKKLDGEEPMYWELPAYIMVDAMLKAEDGTEYAWNDLSEKDRTGIFDALPEAAKRDFSDKKREKLAGEGKALPDGSFPIENKADLANAITAHGRAKDPAKAKKHIIARAKSLGAEAMLPDDWKDEAAPKKATRAKMIKGLYEVGRCADMLQSLHWMHQCLEAEAAIEEDGSPQPAHLREIIMEFGGFVQNLCNEEVEEILDRHDEEDDEDEAEKFAGMPSAHLEALQKFLTLPALDEALTKAWGGDEKKKMPLLKLITALEKAGARHSKADGEKLAMMGEHVDDMGTHIAKFAGMHKAMESVAGAMGDSTHSEHVGKMKNHLGKMAKCVAKAEETHAGMEKCMDGLGVAETHGKLAPDQLAKIEKVETLEAANVAQGDMIGKLTTTLETLQKRLETVENQPAGKRPAIHAVEKGNELRDPGSEAVDAPERDAIPNGLSPEQARARMGIR